MSRNRITLSGILRYRDNLRRLQMGTDQFFEDLAKELAARLLRKVILRTPVGVKPILQGPRTIKVTGERGRQKTFLSAEAARLQQYWSGYTGGTLRRGWTAKTESEAESGRGGGKNVTDFVQNELSVQKIGNQYRITIINPVSYASYVEYGHIQEPGRYVPQIGKRLKKSWVEGQFMLTISEMELRSEAPAIIERRIAAFLRRAMRDR